MTKSEDDELHTLLSKLITAHHILHFKGVLDTSGTIAVRNPLNHNTFFTSAEPANLVAEAADLVMWNVSDGTYIMLCCTLSVFYLPVHHIPLYPFPEGASSSPQVQRVFKLFCCQWGINIPIRLQHSPS